MTIFEFEEIGQDLDRPPLAALRALFRSGVVVSLVGWRALTPDLRRTLVNLGSARDINPIAVQQCLVGDIKRHLKLMPVSSEPDAKTPPERLLAALGPQVSLTPAVWVSLTPLQRHVLAILSTNTRLLTRAAREILPEVAVVTAQTSWRGLLAECGVKVSGEALRLIRSPDFLDGRALMLARASGVRAARRAGELFDLHADTTVGPIELDWGLDEDETGILFQAHVSTWDGAFFPAASLLAAAAAAACVADMALEHGGAELRSAKLAEDTWRVGRDTVDEGATVVFRGQRPLTPGPMTPVALELAAALPKDQTVRDVNPNFAETLRLAMPAPARAPSERRADSEPKTIRDVPRTMMSAPMDPLPPKKRESVAAPAPPPVRNYGSTLPSDPPKALGLANPHELAGMVVPRAPAIPAISGHPPPAVALAKPGVPNALIALIALFVLAALGAVGFIAARML